jgi:general secretion pathway protein H
VMSDPAPRDLSSGFTLFELLVVMVIIGFMAALVVPGIAHSLDNLRLKTFTRDVSASLRYARSRAVSEKTTCFAVFSPEKRTLTIVGEKDLVKQDESAEEGQSDVRREVYRYPENMVLKVPSEEDGTAESGPFVIRFFPNGSSSGGELLLENTRNRRFRILVDFITGLVHVDQPAGDA